MKCDTCKNVGYEQASIDYPYPHSWCIKGHWEGYHHGPEPEFDPWKNCIDYKDEKE